MKIKNTPALWGMNSVEFFGLPVIAIGITRLPQEGYEEIISKDSSSNSYKKIIMKNNVVKGAIFVSSIENIGILLKLAKLKVDVSAIKDRLLRPILLFRDQGFRIRKGRNFLCIGNKGRRDFKNVKDCCECRDTRRKSNYQRS